MNGSSACRTILSVILAFLTSLRGQQDGGGAKKVSLQVGLDLLMSGSRDSLRIHTGKRISVSGEWFGPNRDPAIGSQKRYPHVKG
jgi:hypothetical protein